MSRAKLASFDHSFRAAALRDIGKRRESNQDTMVLCPEIGFFAVSDGMGGLSGGKEASAYVAVAMLQLMKICANEYNEHQDVGRAATSFQDTVRWMSDRLFEKGNTEKQYAYGATFVGCWLLRGKAIFVCLGDSRGYLLHKYKKQPTQITEDHNLAGILVKNGEMTRAEAKNHPASSHLTAFVGMKPPAMPDVFTVDVQVGDRILLCSDGLYGMVEERDMARLLRGSRSPERVCQRLIDRANENGGRDNISAAYIRILA